MRQFNKKTFNKIQLFFFIFVSFFALLYLNFFHVNLLNHEVEHVHGYTRIIVPDSILYAELVDLDDPFISLTLSGVKNSIGPGLIWAISAKDWHVVLMINLLIVWLIVFYFKKICYLYEISEKEIQFSALLLIISPFSWYYSIGALKELPMMLFTLMFTYFFLNKRWFRLFLTALALGFIRYQMLIVLILVLAFMYFGSFGKNKTKAALIFLMSISALYPAISSFPILSPSATEYYRELYGASGSLGSVVETVRSSIYGLSLFAVTFRVLQTLFEPILLIVSRGSFYEDGSFSVFDFMQFITSCLYIYFLVNFLKRLKILFGHGKHIQVEIHFVYIFVLVSLILVCGFSFIHHRYSLPFFPLLIIASIIPLKSFKESLIK